MSAAARMKAPELLSRLQRHYIKPGDTLAGGVFLPEVTHGSAGGRRVDALYVGFTSSRGHHLIGHELKVSRADWLHELDQIDKAETWASQCHAWNLVVPDIDVARPEELPHGWGLLTVDPRTKTRLKVIERPTLHPARQPDWITTHSILKRMDTLTGNRVLEARHKARDDNAAALAAAHAKMAQLTLSPSDETLAQENARQAELLDAIAAALGVSRVVMSDWGHGDSLPVKHLGPAFRDFLASDADLRKALSRRYSRIGHARKSAAEALQDLDDALLTLRQGGLLDPEQ